MPNSQQTASHQGQRNCPQGTNVAVTSTTAQVTTVRPNTVSRPYVFHPGPIIPPRPQTMQVEHVVECPGDPRPNCFYDMESRHACVYHGPFYGNPNRRLHPDPDNNYSEHLSHSYSNLQCSRRGHPIVSNTTEPPAEKRYEPVMVPVYYPVGVESAKNVRFDPHFYYNTESYNANGHRITSPQHNSHPIANRNGVQQPPGTLPPSNSHREWRSNSCGPPANRGPTPGWNPPRPERQRGDRRGSPQESRGPPPSSMREARSNGSGRDQYLSNQSTRNPNMQQEPSLTQGNRHRHNRSEDVRRTDLNEFPISRSAREEDKFPGWLGYKNIGGHRNLEYPPGYNPPPNVWSCGVTDGRGSPPPSDSGESADARWRRLGYGNIGSHRDLEYPPDYNPPPEVWRYAPDGRGSVASSTSDMRADGRLNCVII